jgi:hypothetical protein
MPAPTGQEVADLAKAALQSAGLKGAAAPALGDAIGDTCGAALQLFLGQAMIAPGIPANAPPPPGSGATAGPGQLLPPPVGGPTAAQLEPLASSFLGARGLRGQNAPNLAKVIAGAIAQGIALFTAQVMVAPGITIGGLVTSAPGLLTGSAPQPAAIEGVVGGLCTGNKLQGAHAPDLAKALAKAVADALTQLMQKAKAVPGIPASPGATAGPGRLI